MRHFFRSRATTTDMLLMLACVALVFGRAVGNDFIFNWDDNLYVLDNAMVRGVTPDNLKDAFRVGSFIQYNPLALVSLMLDYTLWGLWPGGYHLTNIVLHAVNGLLVYRLLDAIRGERLVSLLAAMIFLLHPVQVESVAWISERKGLLATCFFLLSWLWYVRYRAGEVAQRRFYGLSLLAYLLSLLAKSVTVIMPVMLIMYDLCHPTGTGRLKLRDKIPYIVLALLATGVEIYSSLLQPGGSKGLYHGGSPLATFYTMLPVFCRYLGLLFWPAGLSIDYDPPIHYGFDATVAMSALLLAFLFVILVAMYRRDRKLAFWGGFFWLCLAPVSQVIPLGFIMFDHYLYLPVIAMGVLVGAGAAAVRDCLAIKRRWLLYLGLTTLVSGLSVASFTRTGAWKNSMALFTDAVRKSPHSFMAWWGLGNVYQRAGMEELALSAYKHASDLKPDSTDVLYTLAALYLETGMPDAALPRLKRLLELNPDYVRGWAGMGRYYLLKNDFPRAQQMYLKSLELQPDAAEVMLELARLAACRNDADTALSWLEKAFAAGWRDFTFVAGDRDFESVQADPHFVSGMKRLLPDKR